MELGISGIESLNYSLSQKKEEKIPDSTDAKGPSVITPRSVQNGRHKAKKKKKKLKDSNFPQNLNQKGESQKQSLGKASFNT